MTKNEFLSVLRGRITGSIPTSEVESQLDYYASYIDGRVGAGLTEEEAVEELGDPRLIAKTVIESVDRAAEAAGYDGPYRSSTDTYDDSDGVNSGIFGTSGPSAQECAEQDEKAFRRAQGESSEEKRENIKTAAAGSLGCIVAVIIFVLIMALLWALFLFVFRISIRLLGWLFPVIAVVAIIALIVNLTRRR